MEQVNPLHKSQNHVSQQNSAILIAPAYPLRGGIASSTERLAIELQRRGYAVTIYTFSLQYPSFLFPGKTQYSEDPPPPDLKIKVKINSVNPLNWRAVGKEIRDLRPNIVITRFWLPFMGPSLGTIIRTIQKNNFTKSLAIIDNIIPHEKRIGDRQLAQYFVNSVDAFIVMSKAVKEEMRMFTKEKSIRYIPHPMYDNYGEHLSKEVAKDFLKLDQTQNYLLFFGFIRDYKGLDLLIEAMSDSRIKALGVKLIIAGEYYSKKEKYEALIEEKKLRESLILRTDFIPNPEVRYYFCASDIVVQPYKTATQSGISQLAYYFNKPMLATAVGGLPEIVEHEKGGYVVPVNVSSIADAIVDFYKNKKEATFVKNVIERKSLFSWGNMVDGIEELLGS